MSEEDPPFTLQEVRPVVRAVRLVFVSVSFLLSYFNVRLALTIPAYRQMFQDMLNGKPLPRATEWILSYYVVVLGLALAAPLAALACVFGKRLVPSLYLAGALILFSIFQFWLVTMALYLPFIDVIKGMSAE